MSNLLSRSDGEPRLQTAMLGCELRSLHRGRGRCGSNIQLAKQGWSHRSDFCGCLWKFYNIPSYTIAVWRSWDFQITNPVAVIFCGRLCRCTWLRMDQAEGWEDVATRKSIPWQRGMDGSSKDKSSEDHSCFRAIGAFALSGKRTIFRL